MPRLAPLIDTHCHVDLYPDPHRLADLIEAERTYCVAVTNAPSVFPAMEAIAGNKRHLRVAIGLHPELAVERQHELPLLLQYLPRTRYVGEVGLDYSDGKPQADRAVQRRIFEAIIEACDDAGNKILTIHSRRAEADVLDAIGKGFRGQFILHWYSGSLKNLERGIELGAFFSINVAMARSRRFDSILKRIPRDRILTESDGPFVRIRNEPVWPSSVAQTLAYISSVWGRPIDEVRATVFENFWRLLAGSHDDSQHPR